MKAAFIFGTRPEVIKLAPVILAIKKVKKFQTILISTGQHDELLKEALDAFDFRADAYLKIMKHGQSLSYILSSAVAKLDSYFANLKPNLTLVEGDTSSSFAAALVSFYHKIPVLHIEAGCRSHNIHEPFPEEANRKLIAPLTSWHFPATRRAQQNLIHEGYDKKKIFLVGSTEVDAVEWILKNTRHRESKQISSPPLVIITTHRRESWGKPLAEVFLALKQIVKNHPKIQFVYSIHPNPLVLKPAMKTLSGLDNLSIISHIPTIPFIHLINRSSLIMTDSGGVQLEAGALLKPVIILRNLTEWTELIEEGIGRLTGTNKESIVSAFEDYMVKKWPKKMPTREIYPKGAAKKIVKIIISKILQ